MFNAKKNTRRPLFFIVPFVVISCKAPWDSGGDFNTSRSSQTEILESTKILFDWNKETDSFICSSIGVSGALLTVGTDFTPRNNRKNVAALDALQSHIETHYPDAVRVHSREERLSLLNVKMVDCSVLSDLRALPNVDFVEPKYLSPSKEDDLFEAAVKMQTRSLMASSLEEPATETVNPGAYNPAAMNVSYPDYIRQTNEIAADRMQRHGLDKIYEEFGHYGNANIGVAILDNGIFEERVDFLSQGLGTFTAEGYLRPFAALATDGPHPQPYDLFGLVPSMEWMYHHGTIQTQLVYTMAPHINVKSVRASSFVFWFLSSQFEGVVRAILAMAEDPEVRIISSSMGTIFHVHEIERAIEYFNAFDKIYLSAGGTSLPFLKEFVRIVFPANLPSTISTTGLRDTLETAEEYVLGEQAHGGLENDFVVDHSKNSSQSVSSTAGMIGLLWSYKPSLNREEMIDILIRASANYQQKGRKDKVFGWGKVDMYQAFLEINALD